MCVCPTLSFRVLISVSLILISFLISFLLFPTIDCCFHFGFSYPYLFLIFIFAFSSYRLLLSFFSSLFASLHYTPSVVLLSFNYLVQAFFFSLIPLIMHITWPFPIHSPPTAHSCEQEAVCTGNLLLPRRPSCWEYVTFHIVRSIATIVILNPTRNTP